MTLWTPKDEPIIKYSKLHLNGTWYMAIQDSLWFFYLDTTWIKALGALVNFLQCYYYFFFSSNFNLGYI